MAVEYETLVQGGHSKFAEEIFKKIAPVEVDSDEGNPITIVTDSVQIAKNTHLTFEPIQDLHGYDHPWPAGGGVNKIDVNQLSSYGTTYGLTVSFDGDWIVLAGEYTNTKQAANFRIATLRDTSVFPVTKFKAFPDSNTSSHMSSAPFGLADGNKTLTIYISGMVQGETYNLRSKIVGYEGDTAPTEWTPYSNICPISGLDEVEVKRTGKNLFGYSLPIHKGYWSSASYVGDDSVVTLENATEWVNIRVPVPDGATITISGMQAQSGVYATWLRSDNPTDVVSRFTNYSMNGTKIVPSGAKYLGLCFNALSTAYADYPNAQINIGSTATDYEPYQGETYDITFPTEAGTVYGGSLTIAEDGSGVLTVDMKMVDLGTLFWYKISTTGSHFRFWAYLNDMAYGGEMLSSQYKHITATQSYIGESGIASQVSGSNYLAMVTDERFSDADTFKTAMSGVQLVYELATPITYTLTPQQLALLKGTNHISTNAKSVKVTFRNGKFATLDDVNVINNTLDSTQTKLEDLGLCVRNGMLCAKRKENVNE